MTGNATGVPTNHFPAGSLAADGASVVLTPETAGWTYSGLRVLDLVPGATVELASGPDEFVLLPLTVREVAVHVTASASGGDPAGSEHDFTLAGRSSVFVAVSDFCYVGRDSEVRITSATGGRLAVASARCERVRPARYQPADAVPVELRGAGSCSRQVNNFAAAGVFDADRIIAVEVITPGGNWSSYPPHKHDEDIPGEESVLEEIYYYEFDTPTGDRPGAGSDGVGYQRVYGTPDRPIDVLAEVRTGDVVAMPHGWHGPSMATPGYAMYYLNVMAGPSAERAWLIRDDPDRGWIRATWADQPVDPRLPMSGPDAVGTTASPRTHVSQQRGDSE
ncbi:MAG TPA: 5-deoxy-glucuronate isomerase [Actinopolymorphaceae bacterium]|jgi:5-deoxy-glucuronate isomerase